MNKTAKLTPQQLAMVESKLAHHGLKLSDNTPHSSEGIAIMIKPASMTDVLFFITHAEFDRVRQNLIDAHGLADADDVMAYQSSVEPDCNMYASVCRLTEEDQTDEEIIIHCLNGFEVIFYKQPLRSAGNRYVVGASNESVWKWKERLFIAVNELLKYNSSFGEMPVVIQDPVQAPTQQMRMSGLLKEFGIVVNDETLSESHPLYSSGARTSIHLTDKDDHPKGLVTTFDLSDPPRTDPNSSNIEFFFDANGKFMSLEFAH